MLNKATLCLYNPGFFHVEVEFQLDSLSLRAWSVESARRRSPASRGGGGGGAVISSDAARSNHGPDQSEEHRRSTSSAGPESDSRAAAARIQQSSSTLQHRSRSGATSIRPGLTSLAELMHIAVAGLGPLETVGCTGPTESSRPSTQFGIS